MCRGWLWQSALKVIGLALTYHLGNLEGWHWPLCEVLVTHVCGQLAMLDLSLYYSLGACRCWVVLACVTYVNDIGTGRFDGLYEQS